MGEIDRDQVIALMLAVAGANDGLRDWLKEQGIEADPLGEKLWQLLRQVTRPSESQRRRDRRLF